MKFETAVAAPLFQALLVMVLFLASCASKPPEVAPPSLPSGPVYHTDLVSAVRFIADSLARQFSSAALNGSKEIKGIPVDLFFNEHSAEEATSSKNLQQQLITAMSSSMPDLTFSPLNIRSINNATWVTLASYANVKPEQAGRAGSWVRLKVVLADVKTGTSVAQVVTYLDSSQFNGAPTKFYKDAPMYLTDAAHQDRNAVLSGEQRPLEDRLRLRAEISEAIQSYEAGQYLDAEVRFKRIIEIAPRNTGALSGLYQALWSQDKKVEAEKVFGQLVAAGIEVGKLSIKVLFKLGATEFIEEADLAQQYQIWLKAIAKTVVDNKTCLDITGHASASGSVEYNDRLSLARAARIVARMQQSASSVGGRLKAYGKGSREAIVGTGTNDGTDAIDRRVEFAVRSCG